MREEGRSRGRKESTDGGKRADLVAMFLLPGPTHSVYFKALIRLSEINLPTINIGNLQYINTHAVKSICPFSISIH